MGYYQVTRVSTLLRAKVIRVPGDVQVDRQCEKGEECQITWEYDEEDKTK